MIGRQTTDNKHKHDLTHTAHHRRLINTA